MRHIFWQQIVYLSCVAHLNSWFTCHASHIWQLNVYVSCVTYLDNWLFLAIRHISYYLIVYVTYLTAECLRVMCHISWQLIVSCHTSHILLSDCLRVMHHISWQLIVYVSYVTHLISWLFTCHTLHIWTTDCFLSYVLELGITRKKVSRYQVSDTILYYDSLILLIFLYLSQNIWVLG